MGVVIRENNVTRASIFLSLHCYFYPQRKLLNVFEFGFLSSSLKSKISQNKIKEDFTEFATPWGSKEDFKTGGFKRTTKSLEDSEKEISFHKLMSKIFFHNYPSP